MLEAGKLIHDRYALIAPIREGRAAVVWRANDQKLRREVAIKFLLGDVSPDSKPGMDEFLREARLTAGVQHRNVVQTVDFGVLDGRQAFLVMELLKGEDLDARMAREPRLGPGPFIHIITTTLRGLAALHDAGLVHRDMQPQNIFLQRDADAFSPKLVGFGSLSVATGDGSRLGTLEYMSPEQARGQSGIDKRSDVYSVAVILFQGLSGRLPFEADTAGDLIAKIATQEPRQLHELCPELPEPLSDLLVQAMSKDRDHRFADAHAMRNAILSAAKTLLPATRRSSASLAPVAAATDPRGIAQGAAQAPLPGPSSQTAQELSGRAGWGDFEGLTRPAAPPAAAAAVGERAADAPAVLPARDAASAPRLPDGGRASGAQPRAATRPSSQHLPAAAPGNQVQPTARRQSSTQLSAATGPSSQQLPAAAVGSAAQPTAKRTSGVELPAVPAVPSRNSIERAGAAAQSRAAPLGAESAEPIGADALDPLYAGADQAAPEIDFERIAIHTKKASPTRAQPTATQPGQVPSRAGKPGGKSPARDGGTRSRGLAWRTWLMSLIAVAAVAYAYVAAGGLAAPGEPGAAADRTATPASSPGIDADLRKMRLEVKGRRHNPGHKLPHLRDVEF